MSSPAPSFILFSSKSLLIIKFTTFIPLLLYQPSLEFATLSCVEGIYKKYVAIAKEKHPDMFLKDSYPPHSMRHTTACHLIEAGVDIVTIKNILGHVSVQTTQIMQKCRRILLIGNLKSGMTHGLAAM